MMGSRSRDRGRPHVVIAVVNLPVERDRRVIRECRALEAAGYRVTVICPRGKDGLTRLPGTDTEIRSFKQPLAGSGAVSFAMEFAWSFLCVAWRLFGLLLRGRVDAMQVCNPPDVFFPLALMMRALGKPFVFDHHDLNPELYECKADEQNQKPNGFLLGTLKLFEKLSMRWSSWVVSTNESYREIAIRRGGCRPERVTVVRNGPAASEIKAAPAGHGYGYGAKSRVVYLGVINPQDHVEAAVLAAEQLIALRGRQDWEMIIAGDGDCLADLRNLATARGISDVVHFTGWLDATEVDDLLATATVGIQPDPPTAMANLSTMAKTVEYVARGVPVVAVDLLESRRTAEGAAVYVPTGTPEELAKAVDGLLDSPEALAAMRQEALERFRTTLSWDHQAAAYIQMWRTLVPVAGPAPSPVPVAVPAPRTADVSAVGRVPRDRITTMRAAADDDVASRTVPVESERR
jgi:glycosyltransferase involved in cell wall biosynthesis